MDKGCASSPCHSFAIGPLCAGLAATARIDHSETHPSPTRNMPHRISRPGAKEFPTPVSGPC